MKQSKKSKAARAAAYTNRATKATMSAVQNSRVQAEGMAKMGSEAVRDLLATGAGEAQKAQEKVFAIGREGAENLARSADAATKSLNEAISMSRDNIEACVECGNIAASLAKELSSEIFGIANNSFSQNVEISKEIFSCRTVNDVFDLQSRFVKTNLDNFFSDSMKLSELFFQYTSEATQPINERVAEATERFSKTLAA